MLEYLFYNLFRTPRQPDKDKHVNQTRTLTDGDTASPSLLFLPHRWLIEWRQRINNFREPQSIVYDVCKFSVILFLFLCSEIATQIERKQTMGEIYGL